MKSLTELREKIENLDEILVKTFLERLKLVEEIKILKEENNLLIADLQREKQLVEKNLHLVKDFNQEKYYYKFYEEIFKISKERQKAMTFGLLGEKIEMSFSPFLHNIFFNHFKDNAVYNLYPCQKGMLENYLKLLKEDKIKGFNVTAPFKETIITYLDDIDEAVKAIKAVNVIIKKDNKTIGYNTDWLGFAESIKNERIDLIGKTVVILGTGGAAKAIYFALKSLEAKVFVVSRSLKEKASFESLISYDDLKGLKGEMVINATSSDLKDLSKVLAVNFHYGYDLNYKEKVTPFLESFAKKINGEAFLFYQGIRAYEIFMNRKLDEKQIDFLKEEFNEQLRKNF